VGSLPFPLGGVKSCFLRVVFLTWNRTIVIATRNPPEQGQLVEVRHRQYVVTEVAKSTLPDRLLLSSNSEGQHLVTLASIEDDALGEELQVIWEIEPGAEVKEKVALPEPTAFDEPVRLDAFLDAVRWGAASAADVRSVQSPFRSGIDIEDYQLDPVVRAVQMPRVNLLIADDVGLGKTIEAGMVSLELVIRNRARRILIVCPASLQIQWRDQMRDKFGLDFRIVDGDEMRQLRRRRGIHVNPWMHFPRLITSIDFIKRERPQRLFKETLPKEGESIYPRRYDVLVLDEAHNCAPSSRGKYATDSLRTQVLRLMVPHFEHKLFLTATPHNGYQESFSALLELLDDQRFARGTMPERKQLGAVMVRRLKSELPKKFDGSDRFPKRKIDPIEVPYTPEEKAIHAALKKYTKLRHQSLSDNTEKMATEFVLLTLKKRLFSSPAAFATTLEQHEQSLRTAKRRTTASKPTIGILQRQIDQVEEEYADDTAYEEATDDAVEAATRLFRDPTIEEAALLKQMRDWTANAKARGDSKSAKLVDWLKNNMKPNGKWSDNRVIIFTEYRATQNWLHTILATEGLSGNDRLMTMYGGMDSGQREAVKAAFQTAPDKSPIRILLATDAASEGLDLQNFCHRLIHYEIPWNPNRMEQRNGRVDRHGQKFSPLIFHFVGQGYTQREKSDIDVPVGELQGDLEFLMRAVRKVEAIREDLGKVGPVIADQVQEAMLGYRARLDTTRAEMDAEPVRKMLKIEQDVTRDIQRLREQLDDAQRELRLSPDNVQEVVDVGLQLAGQPALIPTVVERKDENGESCEVSAFRLPAFSGSWANCTAGLAHPHTQDIRPIVFDNNLSQGHDDVVLAHLNHRLVMMCLQLLRAEVWSTEGKKRLNRITTRLVPDTVLRDPAMIAHARLVVIGGDSHRLHEEIITAGGLLREGRFSRLNVGQVQDALAAAKTTEPSAAMKKNLLKVYPQHADSLKSALEARMKDRTSGLQKALAERADKEAADIQAILTELKRTIEDKLDDPELRQMTFDGWADEERQQLERNMTALRARVQEIPGEIQRETEAVKKRFADPQPRMFPVAVTFLVPERLARG
jgi:ERCC4-related helicase